MRAAPVSPELVSTLKRLRLGCIVPTLCDRMQLADKQSMSHEEFLLLILSDEVSRRDGTAVQRRARDANLDPEMTLERFDKTAKITYDKRLLAELCSLRFLEAHKHITVMGPVGVGKTFVASAIGHLACRHGYNVYFTRADQMLQLLKQSRFDNSRDDRMVELTTVDLLILDDFALDQMSKEESRDIYQLFVERTDRASMIITTNRLCGAPHNRFYAESDVMTSRDLPPLSASARCRPGLRITGRPGQLGNQLVGRLEATGSQTRRDHRLEGLELHGRIGARVHLGRLHVRVAKPERDLSQILGGLQHRERARVPQNVRGNPLRGERRAGLHGSQDVLVEDVLEAGPRHGLAARVEEDFGGPRASSHGQPSSQRNGRDLPQG